MTLNFKRIHIGSLISKQITERGVEMPRICNFMNCTEGEVEDMISSEDLPTDILLRWSKLLEYDFFRIYSQHLILFAPPSAPNRKKEKSALPQFRKNFYSKEVIDFCLEQITTGKMTKTKLIERYGIPKTTLYKWISKYGDSPNQ